MRPESPSDTEASPIETASGPAALVDEGAGRPIVAIHGLPGSVADWRWLAPALTQHVRFIRLDLPGFGGTPRGNWDYDIDARGRFVAGVLDALELEDAMVIGHSMGGAVATSVALHSERVGSLALVASIGTEIHHGLRRIPGVRGLSYLAHVEPIFRLLLPHLSKSFKRMGFHRATEDDIRQTCKVLARVRFSTHRRNLAALRKPTLVAWGADDPLVEDAISEKLYWAAPAGPRIRFETGGHNIQATRASELAEALVAWEATLNVGETSR